MSYWFMMELRFEPGSCEFKSCAPPTLPNKAVEDSRWSINGREITKQMSDK